VAQPSTPNPYTTPEPVEATHRRTGATVVVQPPADAWVTLLARGHVAWTDPDTLDVFEADWP
jgi:hypothetical protein